MSDGVLSQTFTAAMELWDHQKAEGVPRDIRLQTLERTLRAAWPQTREWKYLCQNCNDTGLVISFCEGDATCGRDRPHYAHDYGTPCWCSLGAKFKPKPKPGPEDFTAAAKVSKPTRLGR